MVEDNLQVAELYKIWLKLYSKGISKAFYKKRSSKKVFV